MTCSTDTRKYIKIGQQTASDQIIILKNDLLRILMDNKQIRDPSLYLLNLISAHSHKVINLSSDPKNNHH